MKPSHTVIHIALRREEDDGNPHRADIVHEFKSARTGKHHIQQNQIKLLRGENVRCCDAVINAPAGIALPGETHFNEIGDRPLILHNENSDHWVSSPLHLLCKRIVSQLYQAVHRSVSRCKFCSGKVDTGHSRVRTLAHRSAARRSAGSKTLITAQTAGRSGSSYSPTRLCSWAPNPLLNRQSPIVFSRSCPPETPRKS